MDHTKKQPTEQPVKHPTKQRCPLIDKLLGTRLLYRLFFLYVVGGALPVILIGIHLISGTSKILIGREREMESSLLEVKGREVKELLNTVNIASEDFYFDEKLEAIAFRQYTEYQDIVDDYREYTAFRERANAYNLIVSWISIYMKNDTISQNLHFIKVTPELMEQPWYKRATERGGAVWQYLPSPLDNKSYLSLTRLIRTRRGQEVGVLVMYLRDERLLEILEGQEADIRMVLNGTDELVQRGADAISFSQLEPFLAGKEEEGIYQEDIKIGKEDYLLSCYSISPRETRDTIQLVSIKAYRDILREVERQNGFSILIFLCSVLLSLSMIWLFSWSFGMRVDRFRKQMQKAAAGDLDLVESLGGRDEISELYGYLGTMIWNIQRLLAEVYQERLHAEQLKLRQRDAEFKMLASQINPHFLYNTLETIRMKARINRQPEIEELVKMLAKLLRNNIQAGSREIPILIEVELVESYLKIQKYRFDERIQYQIQVEEGVEEHKILPLLLQPIVENSIIHGLEIKEGTGHITVRIHRHGEDILLEVEDDGAGMDEAQLQQILARLDRQEEQQTEEELPARRPHVGICNVHQRIKLRYGNGYGLTVKSIKGEMTRVILRIPGEEMGA